MRRPYALFHKKTRFFKRKGATFLAKCIQSCVCKLADKHSNIASYLFDLEYGGFSSYFEFCRPTTKIIHKVTVNLTEKVIYIWHFDRTDGTNKKIRLFFGIVYQRQEESFWWEQDLSLFQRRLPEEDCFQVLLQIKAMWFSLIFSVLLCSFAILQVGGLLEIIASLLRLTKLSCKATTWNQGRKFENNILHWSWSLPFLLVCLPTNF